MPPTEIVLLTRDLRIHDHPALAAGSQQRVIPLFVIDDAIIGSRYAVANRVAFLLEGLADLDRSLRELGGRLVLRRGDVVDETMRVAEESDAGVIHVTEDVSAYAQRRLRRLRDATAYARRELQVHPGILVHGPGSIETSSGKHYEVFTPYWRSWSDAALRPLEAPLTAVDVPEGIASLDLPELEQLVSGGTAPGLDPGGETVARRELDDWIDEDSRGEVEGYGDGTLMRGTSRLSAYLHLGMLSPREIVGRADRRRRGVDGFVRQLCWRDFHAQVLAADPATAWRDHRTRGDRWRDDEDELVAWREGRTGYPVVDAGMRQLRHEGWMHNRARLLTASFLVKHLYLDWRLGAQHFLDHLADGDIANNQMNWQWVAGTGTDSRPNRVFNPTRQAQRYDPDGEYVRRWVPELAGLPGGKIHEPWEHGGDDLDYPAPIIDHEGAVARFRSARGLD